MSVGLGLLHKVLTAELAVSSLVDAGITREFFVGKERKVYDMVLDYIAMFGAHPKLKTVAAETGVDFPDFPEEPIDYWLLKVGRRNKLQLIVDKAGELTDAASDGEIERSKQIARDLWMGLDIRGAGDHISNLSEAALDVVAAHDKRQMSTRMQGVPFGLPYLDAVSDGAQGADTVAICGRPSTGKTYFCLSMANCAYNAGEVPLIVSMEMSTRQCARRIMALRSGIPATLIRLGRLGRFGRDKLVTDVSQLGQMTLDQPFNLLQGSLSSSVEDLVVRVQELKPTVLYVDGAYLLRSKEKHDSRWERVTYTAEYLKMIATEFNIPVIATYQFNRRGPGSLGNVAFSDSIGMLASIVLGISDETSEEVSSWSRVSFKLLELLKGREGERGLIRVIYDMARMRISQDRVLKGAGMQALADEEEDEDA